MTRGVFFRVAPVRLWRWLITVGVALLVMTAVAPAGASAAESGSLTIMTSGLPPEQGPSVMASGPGFRRIVTSRRLALHGLRPGRYLLAVSTIVVGRGIVHLRAGAVAYPAKRRLSVQVKSGRTARVTVLYAAVVNPGVRRLPAGILGILGEARDPSAILLSVRVRPPAVGTIFTSGPTTMLPLGLVSKVTGTRRQGARLLVSLEGVPVTKAVPELSYSGSLQLSPANGAVRQAGTAVPARTASVPKARKASACGLSGSSSLLQFGAELDSFEVRQAFVGLWPPQLKLTLAVRTTETLGVGAAAVGINCNWQIAEIGPFDAAVPAGPILVPVYATLPVKAGLHVNGTLQVGAFNVVSTTVAHAAVGKDETGASLSEQGSNEWLTGTPSVSGSAELSASIGIQAGIGIAKAANVHVEASFGPQLTWSSAHECNLQMDLGSLSAGAEVFGESLDTPSFTPFKLHLWSGCQPTGNSGSGSGGSGGGSGGTGGGAGGSTGGGGGSTGGSGEVPGVTNTSSRSLASAQDHACALVEKEGVDCWGADFVGQLGDGRTDPDSSSPVPVVGITEAVELTAGDIPDDFDYAEGYTCARNKDGAVQCWGSNEYGQLGNATTKSSDVPVAVADLDDASEISAANGIYQGGIGGHVCALTASSTVECWGGNELGQLGNGTDVDSDVPVTVQGLTGAIAIATSGRASCAAKVNGTVDCWGQQANLPSGGTLASQSPVEVSGLEDIVELSASGEYWCARSAAGTATCWGEQSAAIPCEVEPEEVCGGSGLGGDDLWATTSIDSISAGTDHACAVIAGTLYCFGFNQYGQLGDGETNGTVELPGFAGVREVPDTSAPTAIAASSEHTCVRMSSSAIECWGRNNFGQLGNGTTTNSITPVHVLGIP